MGSGALEVTNCGGYSELRRALQKGRTPRSPLLTERFEKRQSVRSSVYFDATRNGAVVGCGLPVPGSSVTATAASESFGNA